MDTYKFYKSVLQIGLDEIKAGLENANIPPFIKTIFNSRREVIDELPLDRSVYGLRIKDDALWGHFNFERVFIALDRDDNERPYKVRNETEFCYFKYKNSWYLLQFTKSKGRSELRWFFKKAFEEKRPVIKSEKLPVTIIENLERKYGWIPYLHDLPQNEPNIRRVTWIGAGVDRDPVYRITRQRGGEPDTGILLVPQNGWLLKINPSGSITCFQDPYSESFVKFCRQMIFPFI